MELRHIRYFIAAAEEEHFGNAAERLNITRPAVSQLVSDLEDEIGFRLFERHAHKITLTKAGKALLPQLRDVIISVDKAFESAKRVSEGMSGNINVGYSSVTLHHPIFRATVQRFHEMYPDVTLTLVELLTNEQIEALASGKIDAGFMVIGPHEQESSDGRHIIINSQSNVKLDSYLIAPGQLGVAFPSNHKFSGRESICLAELADEGFVILPKSSVTLSYGQIYSHCKSVGFVPKVVQEVNTMVAQLNLISAGVGVGITIYSREFSYPQGVSVVPLSDIEDPASFVIGWSEVNNTPVVKRIVDTVKELAE